MRKRELDWNMAMTKAEDNSKKEWSTPKLERLNLDLRAVAQGKGTTMDMHRAANASASR